MGIAFPRCNTAPSEMSGCGFTSARTAGARAAMPKAMTLDEMEAGRIMVR
jgi:hypothetical protein